MYSNMSLSTRMDQENPLGALEDLSWLLVVETFANCARLADELLADLEEDPLAADLLSQSRVGLPESRSSKWLLELEPSLALGEVALPLTGYTTVLVLGYDSETLFCVFFWLGG
ncbi:hypothetical protein FKM82_029679 [Ascaphus truei]